jgi:hypothetical protein
MVRGCAWAGASLKASTTGPVELWVAAEAIERQSGDGEEPPSAGLADYVHELQRIALGRDPSASARDRLGALKALVKLFGPQ